MPEQLTETSKKSYNKARIDVIEISAESASEYQYFFTYEDQSSKFTVLRALRDNTAKEVAEKLLDVLAIIGAPRVLRSGNGRKFAEQVVRELRSLCKNFFILHGELPKSEVSCRDFKSLLESWMRENSTRIWWEGLNFVQMLHNTTYRCPNGRVPCDMLFGRNVRDKFQNTGAEKDTENVWMEENWIESLSIDSLSVICEENENVQEEAQSQDVSSKNNDDVNGFSFVDVKNEALVSNKRRTDSRCTDDDETDARIESKSNDNAQSLKCKYCQKQYARLGHYKNHMRTHRAEQLQCKLCDKSFRVPRLYEKHVASHGQDKLDNKEEVNENIKSNGDALTAVLKEEKRQAKTHEISKIANEDRDTSLVTKDSCDKIAENSSQTVRRKLSTESSVRVPKAQSPLECTYCKQKFSFPSVLVRHLRSHTNERPYVCKVCNKSFKQLGHLSQHSLTHHDYRSFQCAVCGVKFESLDSLKKHANSHEGDGAMTTPRIREYRVFECDTCKKVFATKSVLERHILTHTQERQYDCKVCGKRFKQAGHVKSHMLIHTGERRFQCTVCSKRFSLSNSLKKHMYVHNGEKPYQCDVCGARFLEKRNLNGHLLTHTNERPHGCKICGKRYTLADTLRRHVSVAHKDGRTYQCEICAKMFKQLAHLSVHKKVHNDERPFQCHLCEKNFKHKNVLKSHLAIHANVRPFECDVCKATFVRKTNLQTHISSAHMNERPYVCTICGKRFKQISHLNGHVIVHSNLMPYKCDFCDRRCNRLDNLKKHMRLHTKNKE